MAGQERTDQSRLAMMQGWHAIEQMGGHARPGVQTGASLSRVGARMAKADDNARGRKERNGLERSGSLRRESDDRRRPGSLSLPGRRGG